MAVTDFFAGEIATELLKMLIQICRKSSVCKSSAEQLATSIQQLLPIIEEINESGVELPPNRRQQLDSLSITLRDGLELAEKVLSSGRWNLYKNLQLVREMEKLEKSVSRFLTGPIQAHVMADVHHMRIESAVRFERLERQLGEMKIWGEGGGWWLEEEEEEVEVEISGEGSLGNWGNEICRDDEVQTNPGHWSMLGVPQPLPFPGYYSPSKQNDRSNSQSPKEGPSSSSSSGSAPGSSLFHRSSWKNADRAAASSSKTPIYRRRGCPQDLKLESVPHNFRPNVPARSAPTSRRFSSPFSPRRYSNVDLSFGSPQEFGGSSSLEGLVSHKFACSAPHGLAFRQQTSISSPCTPDHCLGPQPLPLPDYNFPSKRNDRSNSHSPKEGPSSSSPSGSDLGCSLFHQSIRETADRAAASSSKTPIYRRRGCPQDLKLESVPHNFRLNGPARSAPTSRFSSPFSPRRVSNVDLSFWNPQEFGGSSSLEGLVSHKFAFSPPHELSTRPAFRQQTSISSPCTPDHCLVNSSNWQSASQNTRYPTGDAFHSHQKSSPESSTGRREGSSHANLHPLPLPPGGLKPSQSPSTGYPMGKHDSSLKKSLWLKGKLIGRGAYGNVYKAINCETGASCALKEVDIIGDDPKSAECIKLLEQEIKVLQHLKHPNIVQYYGCEVVEDHFCIYLEYVHPGSINQYIRENYGAVTECVVRNFTRHILSGLAYLHSTKTLHRDIRGANLLVDSSGVVKLADFGLAKHLTGAATDLCLKGSPHWMAPEVLQAAMRKDYNSQLAYADIWSVGCTVIEMLDGKPPWSEFSGVPAKVMFNVLKKSPPIPETLSSEGKDFLQWCFQRNPANRPSAAQLLEHPFLRSSRDQDASVQIREFSGMKVKDTSRSPRDRMKNVNG